MTRGLPISNRLYKPKYTREDYNFGGMQLRLGGFDGLDDRRRTLLMENSVAVVDLFTNQKGTTFKLVERYVTARWSPSYTFEMTKSGATQTLPVFS